jgi:hypothetical protein
LIFGLPIKKQILESKITFLNEAFLIIFVENKPKNVIFSSKREIKTIFFNELAQ